MKWVVLVLVVLVASCAQHGRYDRAPTSGTLRVLNQTGGHVHIYVDHIKIGVATAGENCFSLRNVPRGFRHMHIRSSNVSHRTMLAEDFASTSWSMELIRVRPRDLRFDLLSLQPAERCE